MHFLIISNIIFLGYCKLVYFVECRFGKYVFSRIKRNKNKKPPVGGQQGEKGDIMKTKKKLKIRSCQRQIRLWRTATYSPAHCWGSIPSIRDSGGLNPEYSGFGMGRGVYAHIL